MFTPHIDLQVEVAAETEHKRLQHHSENYREDGGEGEQTAGQQVRHCTSCVVQISEILRCNCRREAETLAARLHLYGEFDTVIKCGAADTELPCHREVLMEHSAYFRCDIWIMHNCLDNRL